MKEEGDARRRQTRLIHESRLHWGLVAALVILGGYLFVDDLMAWTLVSAFLALVIATRTVISDQIIKGRISIGVATVLRLLTTAIILAVVFGMAHLILSRS